MKTRDEDAFPKKSLKGRYFNALIFFCLLFCQQSIEASDTLFISQWLNSKSPDPAIRNIHIGFFHLDLTTPNLPDTQRITTSEEFNLDSVSFSNLLSVYFGLQNQSSNSSVEAHPSRRFALTILLELFNRNLQSAYQTPENRQLLQQQFTQFYESFTTTPLTPRWAPRQREAPGTITFRDYFDTGSFISQNNFVNADNGLMALMYAVLAPFRSIQRNTSDCCPGQSPQLHIMHDNFDIMQNAFIREGAFRRSTRNPASFEPNNPDLSMFQNIDSLTRHIESNKLQAELLLLMSLRSLAFYAYQTLARGTPVQTDFSQITRENLTTDLSSVLVRNLLEGRLRAYGYSPQEGQLADAFECGILAATSNISVFLWMRASIAISHFQQQDQANTQRLFNALLGGDPVFTESQQQPISTEQPLPIGSQAVQASTARPTLRVDDHSHSLEEFRSVMETISTDGLISTSDSPHVSIDRERAISSFVNNIASSFRPPQQRQAQRTRTRGSAHYNQLAEDIPGMASPQTGAPQTGAPQTRAAQTRAAQTSGVNNEVFTNSFRLFTDYVHTLRSHMTRDGLLQQDIPPPQEAAALYEFFRGYLSHNTLVRFENFSEMPEQDPNVQQQQGNANSPTLDVAALPEPTQLSADYPMFEAGGTCIICLEEKSTMTWIPSCGHAGFCNDCMNTLEQTQNAHTCPLCRADYQPSQRRLYTVPGNENNQNADDENPNNDNRDQGQNSHGDSDDQME